jgi:hypothetical protein
MTSDRGRQSPRFLKLTHDRKVSPRGIPQESRGRWVPTIANSFGLPAGISCPGKTEFCTSCYAVGAERSSGVHDLVTHNYRLLINAGTEDAMGDLIAEMLDRFERAADSAGLKASERIFRIHWDGDFFSLDYARAWARVIRHSPTVAFWAYTRSFVEPINVVPTLVGLTNLSLYLSADAGNVDAAREVSGAYPSVRLAICSVDYRTAREIAPRHAVVCPENSGAMELMTEGRGACVDCKLCIKGKRDVIFSTSHQEDVRRPVHVASSLAVAAGQCGNSACGKPIRRNVGRGAQRKFCSDSCRWKVYRMRQASA